MSTSAFCSQDVGHGQEQSRNSYENAVIAGSESLAALHFEDPVVACARSALVDPLVAVMKSALVSSLLLASATAFVPPSAGPVQSAASTFTRSSRHAAAAKAPAAGLSMR
jgi:hypothetical protein